MLRYLLLALSPFPLSLSSLSLLVRCMCGLCVCLEVCLPERRARRNVPDWGGSGNLAESAHLPAIFICCLKTFILVLCQSLAARLSSYSSSQSRAFSFVSSVQTISQRWCPSPHTVLSSSLFASPPATLASIADTSADLSGHPPTPGLSIRTLDDSLLDTDLGSLLPLLVLDLIPLPQHSD